MDGFLDSRYFDGDKVGDGNFAIFGLANVKSAWALFVVKIVDFLIVDFVERDEDLGIGLVFKNLHDHLKWSGEDSSFLTGKQVINILFVAVMDGCTGVGRRWVVADNRVSFSCASLPVGKNSNVGSEEKLGDRFFEKVKDVLLGGKIWKNVTELHVREIARPLDQKCFLIL